MGSPVLPGERVFRATKIPPGTGFYGGGLGDGDEQMDTAHACQQQKTKAVSVKGKARPCFPPR